MCLVASRPISMADTYTNSRREIPATAHKRSSWLHFSSTNLRPCRKKKKVKWRLRGKHTIPFIIQASRSAGANSRRHFFSPFKPYGISEDGYTADDNEACLRSVTSGCAFYTGSLLTNDIFHFILEVEYQTSMARAQQTAKKGAAFG